MPFNYGNEKKKSMKKKKMNIPLPKRKPSIPKRKMTREEEIAAGIPNQSVQDVMATDAAYPKKKAGGGYMKKNEGGSLKKIDPQKQPGLAALKKKNKKVVHEMGFMKSGGYMKRNKGGKIGRGCGIALRGAGKVMKS